MTMSLCPLLQLKLYEMNVIQSCLQQRSSSFASRTIDKVMWPHFVRNDTVSCSTGYCPINIIILFNTLYRHVCSNIIQSFYLPCLSLLQLAYRCLAHTMRSADSASTGILGSRYCVLDQDCTYIVLVSLFSNSYTSSSCVPPPPPLQAASPN